MVTVEAVAYVTASKLAKKFSVKAGAEQQSNVAA